jgi:hypothetical protein
MQEKRMINIRVTDDEADILASYAEMVRQSQTAVVKSFIHSLEVKVMRVSPEKVNPFLLPSVPMAKRPLLPPLPAIYFFITEGGSVLYIGQTADLSKRCFDHAQYDAALNFDKHARIHWIEMKSRRDVFEKACILRFKPILNTQGK